tara:strand:+ start:236809 stop:237120 length:312 start_codon:yes stop_codon:yes gene_type:complete
MANFNRLTLTIVAVQATIDKRHYAAVYLGDDPEGNNFFKIYLNGKPVSVIKWNRRAQAFSGLQWTVYARNQNLQESFVWPNEIRKKLHRKLTQGTLFRMVKIR